MHLTQEVAKFKVWASRIQEPYRSGEWECDYNEWNALYAAAVAFIESASPETWSSSEVGDVLYAIARDNESEYLVDKVAETPDSLLKLSCIALSSPESDAKWQLADRLGSLRDRVHESEALLLEFAEDKEEYVKRRALLALGNLKSPKTEELAERAWHTGHEYQRIAALWALKAVSSKKLPTYVQKAMEDGREHIVMNAIKVQQA